MLSLGLIGAGEFGNFASQVLNKIKGIKLVAVADQKEKKAQLIARRYHVPVFKDYRKLLAIPEIDMVMVNTPNHLHQEMTISALKAGKHVFCEKPLAITTHGIGQVFAQQEKSRRLLGIDFVLRQNKFYGQIKSKLKDFGNLRTMIVNNQATEDTIKESWYWNPKRSGGWFLTADIHFYDLYFFLAGIKKISSLNASEYINRNSSRTQAITTAVQFKNGSQLFIHHNFKATNQTASCRVMLDFDRGHVELEGWVPTKMTIIQNGKRTISNLDSDRQTEYHLMVKRGLENLAAAINKGLPQKAYCDRESIVASHQLALSATKKANIIKNV